MESVECSRKLTGSPNCCSHWACEQVQQIHSEEESQGMGRGVLTTLTTTVSDGVCPLSVPSAGSFTHRFSFHPHNPLVGGYEPHSCPLLLRGTAGLQSQVPLQSPCSCPPGDLPQCHPISFCCCLLLSQLLFRSCILCQAALRVSSCALPCARCP